MLLPIKAYDVTGEALATSIDDNNRDGADHYYYSIFLLPPVFF